MREQALSYDIFSLGSRVLSVLGSRRMRRYYRNIAIISFGIFLLLGVAALISAFETDGNSRVFAVSSGSGRTFHENEVQTGLLGVISSVSDLQKFSADIRFQSLSGQMDDVLAGAAGVDRWVVRRQKISQGTKAASELGYYAQQVIVQNQLSSDDYYTLLRIVEAEATGGDLMSKMIVAGVVLNRVADSRFPNTIQEVVWQSEGGIPQFSPTQDGRIYSVVIEDETIEAVDRVLAGEDYSKGALFFFARNTSASGNVRWFDNTLVRLFEYGGHEYFTFKEDAQE